MISYLYEPDELTVQQKSPTPRAGQPIGNSKTVIILLPITGQPGGVYHVLEWWQGVHSKNFFISIDKSINLEFIGGFPIGKMDV